ncbi:Mak11p [Saccharomyces cerevisiae x Saccharomyces kudriavzevii VIN7]|uniref:Mak11p n=1 Tax=Saccharomyces cerevisiae x Saccharomyces kudriavzevii (strain VIN7) TaxID=1095631 RepID=H0GXK9_SACCK|nr:Mak11p [Saccharomyces cerevisiae x Saccharomyces kudriavzevii VIN7]
MSDIEGKNHFRIIVGSYEHNILCLSLDIPVQKKDDATKTPHFMPIFHFQAHSLSIKCLAVSRRYLVSGSNDEHIRIYDLTKRKELGTLLSHQGSITALQFSHPASSSEDATVAKGSKNSKWLLSASEDHKIMVWRVKDWETVGSLKGHTARINDMDIHPTNRIAISVSEDHSIRLWNLMTLRNAAVLKLRKYNTNGSFVRWLGAKGDYFAVGLRDRVLIYETGSAKVFKEILFDRKTIMHLETHILPFDNREYLTVGVSDGNVHFYPCEQLFKENEENEKEHEEESGEKKIEPAFSLLGHTNRVKDFKFYKNDFGTYLVTIGSDGKIVVWDMSTKEQVAVYDCGERLNCLTLCDEDIEKYSTMRKRDAGTAELGEQSEVESDTEELKKIMFGEKKKLNKKKKKQLKKSKVSVELE